MKYLYIIRHAKSDWDIMGLDDFDRPLNKRGSENAPFMGELLAKDGVKPDLIISSPALRAKTTAQEIAKKVGYDKKDILYKDELYGAEVEDILSVLKKVPSKKDTVFIFGHNPGLTYFAEYISGKEIGNIPTCGIVYVKIDSDKWDHIGKGSGEFVSFEYPKKYK